MTFSDWQDSGNYFRYQQKHRIFYQKAGKGEILVLLHGFPTASWDWQKIWHSLRQRYHLIAPDFIGFGFSDKPRQYTYSILDQADIIEALLAEQQVTTFHILAHDYGDTVAQELLARFLDRQEKGDLSLQIQSVALLNGGLFPEAHQPRPIQKALLSPLGFLLTPFLNKKKLKQNFHFIFGKKTLPTDQEIDEFYALIQFQNGKYIFHKLIRYMSERKKYRERWLRALQNALIPIRLINGNSDPISGRHLADHYAKLVPKPDIVHLPTIGHYPQTEAPEEVLQAFYEFRNSH